MHRGNNTAHLDRIVRTVREFRLVPREIVPLPSEFQGPALFPELTEWVVRVTTRWIPGASPPENARSVVVEDNVLDSGYDGNELETPPPRRASEKKLEIIAAASPADADKEENENEPTITVIDTVSPLSPVSIDLPTSPTPLLDTSLQRTDDVSIDGLGSPGSGTTLVPLTPLPEKRRVSSIASSSAKQKTNNRASSGPHPPLLLTRARPWPRREDFLNSHAMVMIFLILLSFAGFFATLYYTGYAATVTLLSDGRTVSPSVVACASTFSSDILDMSAAMQCGVDQSACRPFTTFDSYTGIRCPAHCVRDASRYVSKLIRGDEFYTPDSKICQAAAHAGVLDDDVGGCFEARAAGEQWSFQNSTKNGITSLAFGWYPTSVQFRLPANATVKYCTSSLYFSSTVVALGALFIMTIVIRPDHRVLLFVMMNFGFFYLGMNNDSPATGYFFIRLNDLWRPYFIIFFTTFFMYKTMGPIVGNPRRYPFDAYVFSVLPFWALLQLDEIERLGVDFTLSTDGTTDLSTASIVTFVLIALIGVPVVFLQTRLFHRAGLFPRLTLVGAALGVYFLTVKYGAGGKALSFHLHHYFSGICIVALCCGHTKWRYNMVLQAVGLALFVHGVTIFDFSPIFDLDFPPTTGYSTTLANVQISAYDAPVITGFNYDESTEQLQVEWITLRDLVLNFTCENADNDLMIWIPGLKYTYSEVVLSNYTDPNYYLRRQRRLDSSEDDASPPPTPARPQAVDRNWALHMETLNNALLAPDPHFTKNPKTEEFRYSLTRNGVLSSPVDYYLSRSANVSSAFLYTNNDNKNGSSYLIDLAAVGDGDKIVLTPKRIVVPNPYAPPRFYGSHAGYYSDADSLDLCKKLRAIYGTMYSVGFAAGGTAGAWYQGLL